MKKMIAKLLAFILVFSVAVPVTATVTRPTVANAATVALTATKKTIIKGNTYTVALKNSTAVAKKSFKSTNVKVAKVNGKGVVTPIKAGTAKIECTVTLKTGGTLKLVCTITVKDRIAATRVILNPVQDKTNTYIMEVGNKFDFDVKLTPAKSTDSVYYSVADSEIASVASNGVVIAKSEGITVLEARVGLNKAAANKSTNKVVARTYIQVKAKEVPTPSPTPTPTPTVTPMATGVTMVSSKEIQLQFNTAIEKSSVINNNGDLIAGTVTVVPGAKATAVDTLTATLSEDKKTLNISAAGEFNGTYVVAVFNNIMTADGQLMKETTFQSEFKDTVGPSWVDSKVDETGNVCRINFNEAIDISGMTIYSVDGTSNTAVKSYLSNASNYILSADKKSLTINLSGYGEKAWYVSMFMAGIKDLKGNTPAQYQIQAIVQKDASEKPLAHIVDVKRESKSLLVATFDLPIQYGGNIIIDGNYIPGVVDSLDKKNVKYTLTNTTMTGSKQVSFSGWLNYNVVNTTGNSQTRIVDFTLDTTAPKAISYEFTSSTENGINIQTLTIMYDKKISVVNGSGSFMPRVSNAVTGNVSSDKSFAYTASASDQKLILTFTGQNFDPGYYTFTLPAGLVVDKLENLSAKQVISVSKLAGSSNELPPPLTVRQEATNPSKIIVTFANRLDQASAQNVANYLVNNSITPTSATIMEQSEFNAVVELTFASASFTSTGTYTIRVSGVKGFNNSYGAMKDYYNNMLMLVDNSGPQVKSCKLTSPQTIQITLTKNVTGTGQFQYYAANGLTNASSTYVSGDTIIITLPTQLTTSTYLVITDNQFKDANNNLANIPPQISVEKIY